MSQLQASKGLLLVFSEPGTQVSLEEFQDWYDNEHVPLRMNNLSSFLTGARYHAPSTEPASSRTAKNPGWLALYDLTSCDVLQEPSYAVLRETRSAREASIVKRLEVLDRRSYEILADSGQTSASTGWGIGKPTHWIKTLSIELNGRESSTDSEWTERLFASMKFVDGWIRTRVYRLIDGLKTGVGTTNSPEDQYVARYMIIHEASSEYMLTKIEHDPSVFSVKEERNWQLYKAYASLANSDVIE